MGGCRENQLQRDGFPIHELRKNFENFSFATGFLCNNPLITYENRIPGITFCGKDDEINYFCRKWKDMKIFFYGNVWEKVHPSSFVVLSWRSLFGVLRGLISHQTQLVESFKTGISSRSSCVMLQCWSYEHMFFCHGNFFPRRACVQRTASWWLKLRGNGVPAMPADGSCEASLPHSRRGEQTTSIPPQKNFPIGPIH